MVGHPLAHPTSPWATFSCHLPSPQSITLFWSSFDTHSVVLSNFWISTSLVLKDLWSEYKVRNQICLTALLCQKKESVKLTLHPPKRLIFDPKNIVLPPEHSLFANFFTEFLFAVLLSLQWTLYWRRKKLRNKFRERADTSHPLADQFSD